MGGAQAADRTDPSAAWTSRLIGGNSLHGDDDGGGVGDDGGGVGVGDTTVAYGYPAAIHMWTFVIVICH